MSGDLLRQMAPGIKKCRRDLKAFHCGSSNIHEPLSRKPLQ
jgi:hypothetical protein